MVYILKNLNANPIANATFSTSVLCSAQNLRWEVYGVVNGLALIFGALGVFLEYKAASACINTEAQLTELENNYNEFLKSAPGLFEPDNPVYIAKKEEYDKEEKALADKCVRGFPTPGLEIGMEIISIIFMLSAVMDSSNLGSILIITDSVSGTNFEESELDYIGTFHKDSAYIINTEISSLINTCIASHSSNLQSILATNSMSAVQNALLLALQDTNISIQYSTSSIACGTGVVAFYNPYAYATNDAEITVCPGVMLLNGTLRCNELMSYVYTAATYRNYDSYNIISMPYPPVLETCPSRGDILGAINLGQKIIGGCLFAITAGDEISMSLNYKDYCKFTTDYFTSCGVIPAPWQDSQLCELIISY